MPMGAEDNVMDKDKLDLLKKGGACHAVDHLDKLLHRHFERVIGHTDSITVRGGFKLWPAL